MSSLYFSNSLSLSFEMESSLSLLQSFPLNSWIEIILWNAAIHEDQMWRARTYWHTVLAQRQPYHEPRVQGSAQARSHFLPHLSLPVISCHAFAVLFYLMTRKRPKKPQKKAADINLEGRHIASLESPNTTLYRNSKAWTQLHYISWMSRHSRTWLITHFSP